MIKKIVIRDVASYDHEGVTFDDLAKVNFIYGGNGTGKTTIGRLLANPTDAQYSNCQIEWEGSPARVLVYNRDFRKRNFKESIPGVFALGAEGVACSREIEELRKKRVDLGKEAKKVKDRLERVKQRIEVENGRLADNLWYYYGTRPPFNVAGELGQFDKYSFAERVKEVVNNSGERHRVNYNHLYDAYRECMFKENISIDKLKQLQDEVWKFLAVECREEVRFNAVTIEHLHEDLSYWQKEEKRTMRDYKRVAALIEGHESVLTSVLPTIDRINAMLQKSNFTGFSIQPSPTYPNYYQIQREDGSFVNDTLSEGEANFIAFLYYYQLVLGNNLDFDISKHRVLVIDDPMCSLDSNVMLIVSQMIKNLTDKVEQVFVLTHNRAFHKQVSSRQHRADTHYWTLGKHDGISRLRAYGMENPVRGEYAMLWQQLREARQGNGSVGLQNIMRRIIEYYFVEIGGYGKRKLIPDNFSDDPDELAIVTALARWADEGSHGIDDDLYAEPLQDSGERYMEVFRRLFEKTGHLSHYKMMMGEE